jgi:hypothetical protein
MMNGLSTNGVEDDLNSANRPIHQLPGELTIFQSPQSNSFLAANGGSHTPHYDEQMGQGKIEIMKSAGGVSGSRAHDGVAGVGASAPPGGYDGIQSTMNRKDKRFF